jgi:acyl-coenzyme A thioesterase PaaI-like protein
VEADGRHPADRLPELRRLADSVRRVIEATVLTRVPDDELDAAAASLDEVAARLEGAARPGPYMPDGRRLPEVHSFFPYSPLAGYANPLAPPVEVEMVDGVVHGRTRLGWAYQGPPGLVHGAVIAGLFDQALSLANIVSGNPGMTARLTVRYRAPTPIGADLRLEAHHREVKGRRIHADGRLLADEIETATAEAVFVEISPEQAKDIFATG